MYQALLTRKYLTSKIMPLLAMAAVTLSVATVLITWSVMGGFLNTLLASGQRLMGHAAITWPNVGFGHYDELIELLEADDRIDAAAPIIETFGLVQLPDDRIEDVQIRGVEPESFDRVTGFYQSLYWRALDEPEARDRGQRLDPRLKPNDREFLDGILANGRSMSRLDPQTGEARPALVIGTELTKLNDRTETGVYAPLYPVRTQPDGSVRDDDIWMPRNGSLGLTLLTLDKAGRPVDSVTRRLPVANEFQTGVYEADSKTVLVPLGTLQKLLNMGEARTLKRADDGRPAFDPFAFDAGDRPVEPEIVGIDPARVTTVLVRGREGLSPDEVARAAREVYQRFAIARAGEVPPSGTILVNTWEDVNATMIAAVRKETQLVLFIFGIVCFTTVFLVLAIFWSMVSEKTKDVGVLRSLGASTAGVAWLWLRYGVAIGVVGAVVGTAAGWMFTTNINAIHEWLGTRLGIVIWDPRVYYFVEIPRTVDPAKAAIVAIAGVLTCVGGALWPSVRAARMDPVRALRFE